MLWYEIMLCNGILMLCYVMVSVVKDMFEFIIDDMKVLMGQLFFFIVSKGVLKLKYEIKLRDKINEVYGGRWKENEIDKNIEIYFINVMKCMEYRNLVYI